MWKSLRNYFTLLRENDPETWRPLLAVYYVTYACRFKCPYCSDGSGTPYPRLRDSTLSAEQVTALLTTVRAACDYLVLTGGEPLQHPELARILLGTKSLAFDGVILTTNGDGLDRLLPEVNQAVTHLVFSLDSLCADKADAWFGVGAGTLSRILAQIDTATNWPGRRYEIVISSVVTPEGIADLYAVYRYCKSRGYTFAACPQLVGTVAHEALGRQTQYRDFYDYLIAEKLSGHKINGTVEYLEHMRDLRKFDCVPSATLAISPSGQVFYPCLEHGTMAGNLLEVPDLDRLRRQARVKLGSEPKCGVQCHSACALGFSLLLSKPWTAVREGYLQLLAAGR
ncbi:MAG TPA: radical SAM protein [Polyangiaceae bacterium]|nr:radical SAM protein [Polyangiaceae bacterium]